MNADGLNIADMRLSAGVADPTFLQNFQAFTGQSELPNWVSELCAFRNQAKKSEYRKLGENPKPPRAVDCKSWIKNENDIAPTDGIRTRKPLHRSPQERNSKYAMSRPMNELQYQRHAMQLMSNLLSIRHNASPFTLVLDDLNQRATSFLQEMSVRGLSRNINVVIVSFETARFPSAVRYVPAWSARTGAELLTSIEQAMSDHKESLVIIDNMHDIVATKDVDMISLFGLVVNKFASTLVGVYHTDVLAQPSIPGSDFYAPDLLEMLKYLATSIVSCRSLAHVLAAKVARERSLPEPTFGMLTGAEGIVQCLQANDRRGIVLQAEFRRKSGRPEFEAYFLRHAVTSDYNQPLNGLAYGTLKKEFVILLDHHPAFTKDVADSLAGSADNDMETSFNLGLTDKQKAARENVVLPYFDAQKGEGGEGGRILYDMGVEDDFDEEEDEI